jgi:hypothetical protein
VSSYVPFTTTRHGPPSSLLSVSLAPVLENHRTADLLPGPLKLPPPPPNAVEAHPPPPPRPSAALLPNPPCSASSPHLCAAIGDDLVVVRSAIARRRPHQIFGCTCALSTGAALGACWACAVGMRRGPASPLVGHKDPAARSLFGKARRAILAASWAALCEISPGPV